MIGSVPVWRRVVVLIAAASAVGACARPVRGVPEATQQAGSSSTGRPSTVAVDVCSLVRVTDLPYPHGDNPLAPPTEVGFDKEFTQSCRWTAMVDGELAGTTLRFRKNEKIIPKEHSGSYQIGGRTVSYLESLTASGPNAGCGLVMDFAAGGLAVSVVAGAARYGLTCDQGKRVVQVLLAREPH